MANPGIITEQGFAAGVGLGFNPLTEQDKNKVQQDKKTEPADKEGGK